MTTDGEASNLREAYELRRRRENVDGVAEGAVQMLAVITPFVIIDYFLIDDYFWLVQVARIAVLSVAIGVFLLVKYRRSWVAKRSDSVMLTLMLAGTSFSSICSWAHTGYESPYQFTLFFLLLGSTLAVSWSGQLSAFFNVVVYAIHITPLAAGLLPPEHMDIAVVCQVFIVLLMGQTTILQAQKYSAGFREFCGVRELEETKASLEDAYGKLKELDQVKTDFFANVSHELRTPLTLSLGPLESMLKQPRGGDDKMHLETMQRNQLRLLRLINQLLDFSKLEAGKANVRFAEESASDLLRAVVGQLEGAATVKGIKLTAVIPDADIWLYLDREKMEQVLINLLSNAFKFTSKGGSITVRMSAQGDHAQIAVSDTGVGIPEDKLDTIFERFAQVDASQTRQYAGTGIGLSLVKEYTVLHGGAIEVSSVEGKGTTFTLRIPLGKAHLDASQISDRRSDAAPILGAHQLIEFQHEEEEPEELIEDAVTSDRPMDPNLISVIASDNERPTVLVVDDTMDMRRYMKSILDDDYRVFTAKDGAEGLEKAKKLLPDLILSDVMMPVMSGGDLCKAVKNDEGRLATTPVVLVTARVQEQTKLESLEYGADDYLLKPFLREELLLRVRNLTAKHRQEKALYSAHQELRTQQAYIQSDLRYARDFQQSLLPELDMPQPLTGHVEFHPTDEVSGDFYHFMRLGPHRARLILADMADHGVKAGIRATAVWPEYTRLPHDDLDPAEVLRALNDIATSKYNDLSGCFACVDLDVTNGAGVTVKYAQAGEAPMTVVSADGVREVEPSQGFILGLFPGMAYKAAEFVLRPGERLFLFTDGLYTQTDEAGRTFRTEVSQQSWQSAAKCGAIADATRTIVDDFEQFRGSCPQFDDVTILGIELPGGSAA